MTTLRCASCQPDYCACHDFYTSHMLYGQGKLKKDISTMKIKIIVSGCDDTTYVETEVTEDEAAFLKKIAELITEASTYACMPRMQVEKL